MEETERTVSKNTTLLDAQSTTDELFVLKEGWAVEFSAVGSDRRQAVRVYLPGEVIGLSGFGVSKSPNSIVMATPGVVCPFPKAHMTAIFDKAPRLAALFAGIAALDQVAMMDRLALMGAGDARERMAYFLIDLHERLLITNPDLGRRYRLPLRQVDIGQVLGLTKVYVNRLLKSFVEEGLIEVQRPYIRMLKPDVLKSMAGYQHRSHKIDQSWFPTAERYSVNSVAKVPA